MISHLTGAMFFCRIKRFPATAAGFRHEFHEFSEESFEESPEIHSKKSMSFKIPEVRTLNTGLKESLSDFYFEVTTGPSTRKPLVEHRLFIVAPCPWNLKELFEFAMGPDASFEHLLLQASYDTILAKVHDTVAATFLSGLTRHFVERRMSVTWIDAGRSRPTVSTVLKVNQRRLGGDYHWIGRQVVEHVMTSVAGGVLAGEVVTLRVWRRQP